MSTANAVDTRRHTCECTCKGCEDNKTGLFAQRAALDGDPSAAERLSAPIFAFLTAERARRLNRRFEVGDTVSSEFYEFKGCVVQQVTKNGKKIRVRVYGQGLRAGKMVCYWFNSERCTIHRQREFWARVRV
jgi:hypothetical protein